MDTRRNQDVERVEIEPCLICRKPVPDYVPQYCCRSVGEAVANMCGCGGSPTEPCVCSDRCWQAVMDYIGHEFDERRKLAGIELWRAEEVRC